MRTFVEAEVDEHEPDEGVQDGVDAPHHVRPHEAVGLVLSRVDVQKPVTVHHLPPSKTASYALVEFKRA
jgi:hypothetical protein